MCDECEQELDEIAPSCRWTASYWHFIDECEDDHSGWDTCEDGPHHAEGLEAATHQGAFLGFVGGMLEQFDLFPAPMAEALTVDIENPAGGYMTFFGVQFTNEGPRRRIVFAIHQNKRDASKLFDVMDDRKQLLDLEQTLELH